MSDKDTIYRQAAIDVLDVLCQEHRYRIPGKRETYSQYNEAWQDALGRAECAIGELPSAQPAESEIQKAYELGKLDAMDELIQCKDCKYGVQDEIGRWYCRGLGCQIGDDDGSGFCSDSERREE